MNKHWDEATAQAEPAAPAGHDASRTCPAGDRNMAGELHFRELVNILWRRRRLILTTTLCGTMTVFALGLCIPPKYTATAQIAIATGDAQVNAPMRDDIVIETHVKTLLTRDHLQRVADSLQAPAEPGAASPADKPNDVESAARRAPLRNVAPSWLPTPSTLAQRLKVWIRRPGSGGNGAMLNVDQLERNLRIGREGVSRIVGVSFASTDPDTAAIVADRVAELYIETKRERERAYDTAELARLDDRIAELKADIERSGADVRALVLQRSDATRPPGEIRAAEQRLQQLESEAVTRNQLYRTLQRRQQGIRDQRETVTPGASILSLAATPDRPSSANPILFIPPAVILFLICGSLLSVLLERLDRGLRSEREINEVLGVPCVGLVPQVAETDQTTLLRQCVSATPFTAYAEALRSIAAAMQSPWRQPKVVLITSSLPGEGKSTLAVSLSACLALLRQRVLLIDFDLRPASIPRAIEGGARRAVVDLPPNDASPADAIQPVPELGIDYLPVNRLSTYPPMRFAAVELPSLLHKLRDSYDCVMIKAPPVLGSSETRLLANLANEILFVVKWGSTKREFAQSALSLLRNNAAVAMAPQLQSVSAVITQVDLGKHAGYGYGDVCEYFSMQKSYSTGSSGPGTATSFGDSYAALRGKCVGPRVAGDRQADAEPLGLVARIASWARNFL
jgi:succinoglycan biosynthesis transport protein ExoP